MMSYGWVRTEILGGLVNGCSLVSLCFYIVLESIPKFIHPEAIANNGGFIIILIAAAGLFVNLVGTVILGLMGLHSHAGHSHSHEHGHDHTHSETEQEQAPPISLKDKKGKHEDKLHVTKPHKHDHGHGHDKHKHKMNSNIAAVFFHYLGDALSSVFVLSSGLLLHYTHGRWLLYIDPIASLFVVFLILATTLPLVKRCAMILLQSVPTGFDYDSVIAKLLKVEGIVNVHELHAWQLSDAVSVASLHISVNPGIESDLIISQAKDVLHKAGVHSSTIQFEPVRSTEDQTCKQSCIETCEEDWCCTNSVQRRAHKTPLLEHP